MKSSSSLDLSMLPCKHLSGVGQRIAERLARLDIHFVQDLLFHLPSRYQDRTRIYPMATISSGDHVVIEGEIAAVSMPKGGRTKLLCRLEDATGRVHLRFFYLNTQQMKTLKVGTPLRCFGEVRLGMYGLEMIHPEYTLVTQEIITPVEENLTPIYPTTEGLSQRTWRKLITQALHLLSDGGSLHDILPNTILESLAFPTLAEALNFVHSPPADAPLDLLIEKKHDSQKRLVFEELLAHRLSLLSLKNLFQVQYAIPLPKKSELMMQFLQSLTFKLTGAQQKV